MPDLHAPVLNKASLRTNVPCFLSALRRKRGRLCHAVVNSFATNMATATTTPQNNSFNERKPSLCTCVLNFRIFLYRPLQKKTT